MRPISFLLTLSIAVPAEVGCLLSYGNEAIWRHLESRTRRQRPGHAGTTLGHIAPAAPPHAIARRTHDLG